MRYLFKIKKKNKLKKQSYETKGELQVQGRDPRLLSVFSSPTVLALHLCAPVLGAFPAHCRRQHQEREALRAWRALWGRGWAQAA